MGEKSTFTSHNSRRMENCYGSRTLPSVDVFLGWIFRSTGPLMGTASWGRTPLPNAASVERRTGDFYGHHEYLDVGGLHMTNTEEPAVLVGELAKLELSEERPVIYDRPIGVRLLYSDPRSGAEHYLIRYPVDLRAQPHRHSAAHTIVVLEGVLLANDQLLLAGSYAHFPRGALMRHEPAAGHYCLFVIVFDGPFDVAPLSGESG